MSQASGGSDTPQRNMNNFPDLNAHEIICGRWQDFQLNDDGEKVGEIW